MPKDNPIPIRLKEARKKVGISQKNLGVKIGMESNSASGRMNHYEKGRHVPDLDTLSRIAEKLDVPLNYFFCKDIMTAELACLINKLNEKDKQALLETLMASQ